MARAIERIVVKLMANATDYLKSVNQVISATIKMASDVTGHVTKMISTLSAQFAKLGVAAVQALGKVAVAAVDALGKNVKHVTQLVGVLARELGRLGSAGLTGASRLGSAGLGALGKIGSAGLGAAGRIGSSAMNMMSGGGGPLGMMLGVAGGLGVHASLSSLTDLLKEQAVAVVQAGAEWQRLGTAFEVMTGSAERGKGLLENLEALAIKTPYQFKDMAASAQTLMGMGVNDTQIVPTLSRLGDVAAGDVDKLKRLSYAYGQVMAAGKFMGTELRQFTEAGVGLKDFAETAGVTATEFRAQMEAGLVASSNVAATINRLTSEGGRFYGMNDRQNQTMLGQWNALNETIDRFRRRIGDAFVQSFDVAGKIGELSHLLESAFDEKAIQNWMGEASKAVEPILEALRLSGRVGGEFLSSVLGSPPEWKDVQEMVSDFAFEAAVSFAELTDAIEASILKLDIFAEKVGKFLNKDVVADVAGPVNLQMLKDIALGPLVGGQGIGDEAFQGAAGDDRQKQIEKIQGRNRRLDMEQRRDLMRWTRNQLAMGPFMPGEAADKIAIQLTLSPQALQEAVKIKRELAEGITPWEEWAKTQERIGQAMVGVGTPAAAMMGAAGAFAATQGAMGPSISTEEGLIAQFQNFLGLEKALGVGAEQRLPTLMARGSAEASGIINQTSDARSMQDRMLAVQEAIKDKNEAMEKEMKEFNANLKSLPGLTIVKRGKK